MGAVFFLIFLGIIFLVALFFIFLSTILIILWNVKKSKGKPSKKWWLIIPVVLLVINVIVALVPVGYIGFLRYSNNSNKPDIIDVQSGKTLYWPMGEYEPTTNWFEMDGVKYVRFHGGFPNESFFLDYSDERLGEPIANIKYNPSDSNSFHDFMWILLSGSTYSEQNISTVYPVKNDNGFAFYYVKNSPGSASMAGGTFCAEDEIDSIKAYYADEANYDTRNLICEYTVYADNQGWNDQYSRPHEDIKRIITLKEGVFDELDLLYDLGQDFQRVEIPQKYNDIAEAAVPETPFSGYDERWLYAYSKDRLAYRHIVLVLIEGMVYVEKESGYGYIGGYPLSDEMNQYIIDSVFTP